MDVEAKDFQLILLPGRFPPPGFERQYDQAYQCWRGVWEDAYQNEMGVKSFMHSDDFTRQDEIVTLFYKGECAGLFFYKWIDGAHITSVHDSYFKCWPDEAYKKLCRQGNDLIVCSQFTLNFKFRRGYLGVSWKDLLIALVMKRFEYSGADAMTGTMRLEKNMGEITYNTGATPLIRNLKYEDHSTVDLVAWFKGVVHDSTVPGIAPIVNEIISKQTIPLVRPLIPPVKEIKRAA